MPYDAWEPYDPSPALHRGVSGNMPEDIHGGTIFCCKSGVILGYRKIYG
jgi:hypothetical protein